MTWFENSPNEAESEKLGNVRMFVAVDFDFPSAHVRVWSGVGTLTFGGYDYLGIGTLGSISMPAESDNLVTEQKTYQLSGVDPALLSEADIDGCFGRSVTEYFGFLDPDTGALVSDPEVNWEGRIDQIARTDGKSPVIEVNAEHRSIMLDQSSGQRYTDEHQQEFFPGDKGLDQVATINTKTVIWGGQRVVVGTPPDGNNWSLEG